MNLTRFPSGRCGAPGSFRTSDGRTELLLNAERLYQGYLLPLTAASDRAGKRGGARRVLRGQQSPS